MYIQTKKQYARFESDELTDLLDQITFKINSFGLWQSDHDTRASFISEDIEIVYYKTGGSLTTTGNHQYECPENSILILEPFQLNTSINQGYESYAYYYLHFDVTPVYLRHQLIDLLIKHGQLIYPHEVRDFREMMERLAGEADKKEIGYSSVVTSALMRIIVEIIRAQRRRQKDDEIKIVHSSYIPLVNEAVSYIQEHLGESIRLEKLASDLGVSVGVLYKAFKQVLYQPPAAYIQQQKIHYAKKALTTDKSVTAISQELGYSSAYHFSKVFKQLTGFSPRDYKKKMNSL